MVNNFLFNKHESRTTLYSLQKGDTIKTHSRRQGTAAQNG